MKKVFLLFAAFICMNVLLTSGQTVPPKIVIGDMKLIITPSGQKAIQKEVDQLIKNEKYLNIKVQRAYQYFPIIERIFAEVGVPQEFKFLALQESALIQDIVSSSNAVGFWQFKKPAAYEVGLSIDKKVDHRQQIHLATRGAAKYMLKNNMVYFDNWILALEAYQRGPGEVSRAMNPKQRGKKTISINKKTYWYVIKFLAHKVAFEYGFSKFERTSPPLGEFVVAGQKNFKSLSKATGIDVDTLKEYNKWIKKSSFSLNGNKIVYPVDKGFDHQPIANQLQELKEIQTSMGNEVSNSNPMVSKDGEVTERAIDLYNMGKNYPEITNVNGQKYKLINGLKGKKAGEFSNALSLASDGGISLKKFYKYNELKQDQGVNAGEVYYFQKKKTSITNVSRYVVKSSETLWSISQKFGLSLKVLKKKNRIVPGEGVTAGRVLYLNATRPKSESPTYIPIEAIEKRKGNQNQEATQKIEATEVAANNSTSSSKDASAMLTASIDDQPIVKEAKNEPANQVKAEEQKKTEQVNIESKDEPKEEIAVAKETKERSSSIVSKAPESTIKTETVQQPEEEKTSETNPSETENKTTEVVAEDGVHIVQPSETLFAIARKYKISVKTLLELNDEKDVEILAIGQKVNIPTKNKIVKTAKKVEPKTKTVKSADNSSGKHTVSQGETLFSISRKYNTSIKSIQNANNLKNYSIKIGEILVIPEN